MNRVPETTRAQRAHALFEFLRTIQRPDRPLDGADERTSLVDAGLIDSLALLEIVTYLEESYGLDFGETGVDPEALTSIGGILDLIERSVS
jgi:acyl carrier protein